jgi:hypothetical protein
MPLVNPKCLRAYAAQWRDVARSWRSSRERTARRVVAV